MFWDSFRITALAVLQILILGAVGFVATRKNLLEEAHLSLEAISRFVIYLALPCFIMYQLLTEFDFRAYPHWWMFPLFSFALTALGMFVGTLLSRFVRGADERSQFINLTAFQNSGYLVLALITALFPAEKANVLFVYLALFLMGFNLVIFSVGLCFMTHSAKAFKPRMMVNPVVVAIAVSLLLVLAGLNRHIPQCIMGPVRMMGNCTLPLALFVVGGNLAELEFKRVDSRAVSLIILGKLVIVPAVVLVCVLLFGAPYLIGAFLVMQASVPSAVTLSVIMRNYRKPDLLISQGIFYSHIVALITVPVFLSVYFTFAVVK